VPKFADMDEDLQTARLSGLRIDIYEKLPSSGSIRGWGTAGNGV
jgi:hypothetical protein